jgi:hypothetical protein
MKDLFSFLVVWLTLGGVLFLGGPRIARLIKKLGGSVPEDNPLGAPEVVLACFLIIFLLFGIALGLMFAFLD